MIKFPPLTEEQRAEWRNKALRMLVDIGNPEQVRLGHALLSLDTMVSDLQVRSKPKVPELAYKEKMANPNTSWGDIAVNHGYVGAKCAYNAVLRWAKQNHMPWYPRSNKRRV